MSAVVAADAGPMARFDDVKADPAAPQEIFRLLTDNESPLTLRDIAKVWRVPRGRLVQWYTVEHAALYEAALKVKTDELAHEALAIADEQAAVEKRDGTLYDPDVPRDKLRVETRLKLAEKWDRARYGAQVKVEHGGAVVVDAGLLGTIGSMLALAAQRRLPEPERVIESDTGNAGAGPDADVRHPPDLARPPERQPPESRESEKWVI